MSLDSVANMPCNPSIGGTAKGHLVFEIDALGGVMGEMADKVTLQSRTLNLGKGAAVHSKRIQADRKKYQAEMKHTLEKQENLYIKQAEIVDIKVENGDKEEIGIATINGFKKVIKIVDEEKCLDITLVLFPRRIHASKEPIIALPIPIHVAERPYLYPNCPA